MDVSKEFICDFCGSEFTKRQALWRHKNNLHKEEAVKEKRKPTVKCGICESLFFDQYELCHHINGAHQIKAEILELEFLSEDVFSQWLKEKEHDGLFHFKIRGCATNIEGIKRKYFYCHRSGDYESESTGKRAPSRNGSNCCGFQCTAFAFSKTDTATGHVSVAYCLQHYKHGSILSRLRLPDDIKQKVAQYLTEQRSFDWILKKIGEDVEGGHEITRQNLITRKDIGNLQRTYGLRVGEKSHQDMDSVAAWVKEYELPLDENVEPMRSPFFAFHPLQSSNDIFILGIQTDCQLDMLQRFGTSAICVDATHKTTMYSYYLLVTILVIPDHRKGYPVAWFIVSNETKDVLELCFKALRERTGPLCTKVFMSDDAPQYWAAWQNAFADENDVDTKKLLCTWHVLKNWRSNLKSKLQSREDQYLVWTRLNILLRATEETEFRNSLAIFLTELEQLKDHRGEEFRRYFYTYYCSDDARISQWALWARRDSIVNTNMYLESFHRTLKHRFLNGCQNRRMDFLIHILLREVSCFYQREYVVCKEKGLPCSNNYRVTALHSRHRNSMTLKPENLRRDDEGSSWFMRSDYNTEEEYQITRVLESCPRLLKCSYCGVCPELYNCSCSDALLRTSACKHIHFVRTHESTPSSSSSDTPPDEMNSDVPNPSQYLRSASQATPDLVSKVRGCLTRCLGIVSNMCHLDVGAQRRIAENASSLEALMETLSMQQQRVQAPADSNRPANLLVERQKRFAPTRSSAKKICRDNAFAKPTREETAAVIAAMKETEPQICGLCFKNDDDGKEEVAWLDCDVCQVWCHRSCCAKSTGILDGDSFICHTCVKNRRI